MLPLTIGSLIFGPVSGYLSDRFGARPFATGGMLIAAVSFFGLILLPVNFPYWAFGALLLVSGIGGGLFFSPNMAGIMNSVPARQRGAAAGMRATFQNSATVVSIGVFFSLMIAGLSNSLPSALKTGLTAHAVPPATAAQISHLPPWPACSPPCSAITPWPRCCPLMSSSPFPRPSGDPDQQGILPAGDLSPVRTGLAIVFIAAAVMALVAAWASWIRGGLYVHDESASEQRPMAAPTAPEKQRPAAPPAVREP